MIILSKKNKNKINKEELGKIKYALIFKKIAKLIKIDNANDKVFNRYEYYKLGGLPFRRALSVIYKLYENDLITKSEYDTLHSYLEKQLEIGSSRNKDFILSTYYQFGDYVISEEEKQNIWHSINELGLQDGEIDDLVFSAAVRAYAYENGFLKIKNSRLIRKKHKMY